MFNQSECSFALNAGSRCVVAQTASRETHRFVTGTCSLSVDNELSVLEYDEDNNILTLAGHYAHPHQVWNIDTSPKDPSLVITAHVSKTGQHGATMWRMPGQSEDDVNFERADDNNDDNTRKESRVHNPEKQPLESLGTLKPISSSFQNSVRWHTQGDQVLSTSDNCVSLFKVDNDSITHEADLSLTGSSSSSASGKCTAVWDAHNTNCILAAYGSNIHVLDTRHKTNNSDNVACTIQSSQGCAAANNVLSIDSNCNKPNTFVTGSDDRLVRFWDSRKLNTPLKTLAGHSHWVTTVRYNPSHDQLLLSSGSDNLVNLWRVASCSSSPWLGGTDDHTSNTSLSNHGENQRQRSNSRNSAHSITASSVTTDGDSDEDSLSMDPPDVRVSTIDQHTESVYSTTWGSSDAWVYASVSYDGRVALNHVPSSEKYKILL